jgi:hypothetical protein
MTPDEDKVPSRSLPAEIEETIDLAREYGPDSGGDPVVLARDFAEAVVQLADACVIGLPCKKHGGAVHGREAEELRAGIERLLAEGSDDFRSEAFSELREIRQELLRLLDAVDARDSLGFLESVDGDGDQVVSL